MWVSLIEFVKRHHLEDEEDVGAVTLHPGDSCLQWKSRTSQVVRVTDGGRGGSVPPVAVETQCNLPCSVADDGNHIYFLLRHQNL